MSRSFRAATPDRLEANVADLTAIPMTVAAKFKSTASSGAIYFLGNSAVAQSYFALYISGNSLLARANDGGAATGAVGGTITQGSWQHAAGVFTSSTSRQCFLDGVGGTIETTASTPAGLNRTSIGRLGTSAPGVDFDGLIAELGVWNVALTAAEIAALAAGVCPLFVRPSALVAYRPLLGNYSPEPDLFGRNELTVTTATAGAHPPILYTTGRPTYRHAVTTPLPGTPGTPSPANGATRVAQSSISWAAATNATSYDVAFGTVNPPPTVATAQTAISYAVTLTVGTTYYWKITANNGAGSTAGSVWSFVAAAATDTILLVNSTDRSLQYERETIEILDELNELPNTCSFECFGFTPTDDQVVRFTVGVTKQFEGTITGIAEYHDKLNARIVFRVSCTDYSRDFDTHQLVTKAYGSQSGTAIAQDIVTNYSTGFTQVHIAAALPTVPAIQFKMVPPASALRQLCDAIGGDTYIDYDKDVHVFLTETDVVPATLSSANTDWRGFKRVRASGPAKNRIFVEGMGTAASAVATVGATSISVDDNTAFSTSGGSIIAGNQILAYTSIGNALASTAGTRPTAPASAPTLAIYSPASAPDALGAWQAAYSFLYSDGRESLLSTASAAGTVGTINDGLRITGITVGGVGCVGRRIYLLPPGSSVWFRAVSTALEANNVLTANDIAAQYTSTAHAPTGTASTYPAGSPSVCVADCSQFSAFGGNARSGTQTFIYTGRSAATGTGMLTGIPYTGSDGALTATITSGDAVTNSDSSPAITGVTGLITALSIGDELNLLVQRDDATSQSTYGIRVAYVQDRRLSLAGAQARGDAELTMRKDAQISGSYITEDPNVRSGRQVTISMASEWGISGTYTITKVRLFFEPTRQHVQREVTFANHGADHDLYRLLRRFREQQQQQTAA